MPILFVLIGAKIVIGGLDVEEWDFPSDRLEAFQKRKARELFGKRSSPPAAVPYERHSRRTRELFGKRADPFAESNDEPLMAVDFPEEDEHRIRMPRAVFARLRTVQNRPNDVEEEQEAPFSTEGLWLLQRPRRGVHRELFG
uniref:Uncharacterized protein n=1 Tax=Globodera rostochiensis TaxID=31243 RepID=A0A914GYS1_GLORO